MKLGSLFDGIGGFPLSGTKYGFEPVWASEIEPFPVKVTQRHFPGMKHLGDITKINGAEIEPVDAITFGSPCQDLSVAGKREGLIGERSGLFRHAIRVIRGMRAASNNQFPRFIVWENVPGAFSSNNGEDFRTVLSEIAETEIPMPASGKWAEAGMVRTERVDIAWRTLDAQYWGVAQRRKRIYAVADFRGQCAGEILFVEQGLSGDSQESRETGQEAAGNVGDSVKESVGINGRQDPCCYGNKTGTLDTDPLTQCVAMRMREGCAGGGKGPLISEDKSLTLGCNNDQAVFTTYWDGGQISDCLDCSMLAKGQMMPEKRRFPAVLEPQLYDMTHADEVMRPVEKGIAPTLNSRMGTGGNQVPVMLQPCAISLSSKQQSLVTSEDIANTLGANDYKEPQVIAFQPGNLVRQAGAEPSEEVFPTLGASTLGDQFPCVAFAANQRDEVRDLGDKAGALQAKPGMKQQTFVLQGSMIGRADKNGPQGDGINEDVSFTLNTTDRHAVAYPDPANTLLGKANLSFRDDADTVVTVDCRNLCENKELSGTLQHKESGGYSLNYQNPVRIGYAVRRLTPTEALRLQGFPDWWLDIEGMSDTAKYKAIGNSVAIPCVDFVMSGIDRVMRRV